MEGLEIDANEIEVVNDSGWRSIHRVREVQVSYRGVSYHLRRWYKIPLHEGDDYDNGNEWGIDNRHTNPDNIPDVIKKFLEDAIEDLGE
jgi:hypothetical protein